jgi:hypothetical protein
MFFVRVSGSHLLAWLKLPAGSRLSPASLPTGSGAPFFPKRSRLFTAAILVVITILFFLPQSREAVSTVHASWHGFSVSTSDLRTVENLGIRAEKEKDARTLAFVSLVLPNSNRATSFADRAVALDPTLLWIYASRVGRPEFAPPPKEALARLLESDHDNAFPELLAARVIAEPRYQTLILRGTPSDQEIEETLASDSAWITHMDRAFHAPHYDSYFNRSWQLTHGVWNREEFLSPSVILCSLLSHSLPDSLSIKIYGNLLVHRAQEAFVAGHLEDAEKPLLQLDSFGRRLTDQSETDIERLAGLNLSRQAANEFRNLYTSSFKVGKREEVTRQLEEIDSRRNALMHFSLGMESSQFRTLKRKAMFVQFSTVLAALLVLATVLSLFALESQRETRAQPALQLRRAVCLVVDWAPITLLLLSIAVLWAFQPFAGILRKARGAAMGSDTWHTLHFEGLLVLSTTLRRLFDPLTPYHFWQITTCTLLGFVLFFLLRGFLRHRGA